MHFHSFAVLRLLTLSLCAYHAAAWGSSKNQEVDSTVYGKSLQRDWLSSGSISIKLEGCVWGYVEDNEDAGCLDDSSEDGTYYWYQMANCRRAQAVVSVYASSGGFGGASCNSGNFQESFITKNGLSEFIYLLSVYDSGSPFNGNYADDDGGYNNNGYSYGAGNIPMCEYTNGGYVGVACAEDGTFALQYFNDQYCMTPTGKTYDGLKKLNRQLKSYKSCNSVSSSNNGGYNLAQALVYNAASCSQLDSNLCGDNSAMSSRRQTAGKRMAVRFNLGGTWVTKLKYVTAGMLLVASFIMFTGILFTNRRRRRALMQRKYRQSKSSRRSKSRSGSKSRSKSTTRDSGTRKSSRSKSRSKNEGKEDAGVFT